ncbi:DNA-binding transcriptional regulator, ArsR family [Leifsonia sp. 21MFCrub1.1]|nr:DNA-binding transcriptional regulator, ArsR family [Leifsonia sp. 21MFCrub1.1]
MRTAHWARSPAELDRPSGAGFNLHMHADKPICGRLPDSQYVELAVEVFAMLADATRVRIVLALRDAGELSVNHLADILDKQPAAVSQHLAKLRLARIVATRQDGQRVFYRLENEHVSRLVSDAIFQAEHSLGGIPRHHHPAASAEDEATA